MTEKEHVDIKRIVASPIMKSAWHSEHTQAYISAGYDGQGKK